MSNKVIDFGTKRLVRALDQKRPEAKTAKRPNAQKVRDTFVRQDKTQESQSKRDHLVGKNVKLAAKKAEVSEDIKLQRGEMLAHDFARMASDGFDHIGFGGSIEAFPDGAELDEDLGIPKEWIS